MGAALSASRCAEAPPEGDGPSWPANGSRGKQAPKLLGAELAVFEPVGKNAEEKCRGVVERFFLGLPVDHDARHVDHVSDPATIVFLFELDPRPEGPRAAARARSSASEQGEVTFSHQEEAAWWMP